MLRTSIETLQFNRLMDFESRRINKISRGQVIIFGGEVLKTLNRSEGDIHKKVRNLEAYTFNATVGDLKGCSYSEALQELDLFAKTIKKIALVHQYTQPISLNLYKFLMRIDNQPIILDCGNQDIDAGFTSATHIQYSEHDDIDSYEVERSLQGSESVIGLVLIRGDLEVGRYNSLIQRIWNTVKPSMVSIGIALDTSLKTDYQLQLISCKGTNSAYPNLVEVEDDYIVETTSQNINVNGEVKCINATLQGTGDCINVDEYFNSYSLDYYGRCGSCVDRDAPLSIAVQEGYFDNAIKLHESSF